MNGSTVTHRSAVSYYIFSLGSKWCNYSSRSRLLSFSHWTKLKWKWNWQSSLKQLQCLSLQTSWTIWFTVQFKAPKQNLSRSDTVSTEKKKDILGWILDFLPFWNNLLLPLFLKLVINYLSSFWSIHSVGQAHHLLKGILWVVYYIRTILPLHSSLLSSVGQWIEEQ